MEIFISTAEVSGLCLWILPHYLEKTLLKAWASVFMFEQLKYYHIRLSLFTLLVLF